MPPTRIFRRFYSSAGKIIRRFRHVYHGELSTLEKQDYVKASQKIEMKHGERCQPWFQKKKSLEKNEIESTEIESLLKIANHC